MIIDLLIWLLISLICLIYGTMLVAIPHRQETGQNLPLIFLCGLSIIGIIAWLLSLFFALGTGIRVLLFLPCLVYLLKQKNRAYLLKAIGSYFSQFSRSGIALLTGSILLVLLITTHTIIHPDTLSYHCQSIMWMEKYPPVPGLANLQVQLGFQSIWFCMQALFNFWTSNPGHPFYINGCLMAWLSIFLVSKMTGPFRTGWILLFLFCFVSWTQIRLTAASASPDFVAALFIWCAFYFFQKPNLSFLFGCMAIAIKYSTAPIALLLLFILYLLIRKREFKSVLLMFCLGLLIILPGVIRNYIASGYPFYPSLFFSLRQPDWSVNQSQLLHIQHYITVYARFGIDSASPESLLSIPIINWIPIWWSRQSWPDTIFYILFIALFIGAMMSFKRFLSVIKVGYTLFFIALIGSLIWFFKAPDLRFGSSFLIPLSYFFLKPLGQDLNPKLKALSLSLNRLAWLLSLFVIWSYAAYRVCRFMEPKEIIIPSGISIHPWLKSHCGCSPPPCFADSTKSVEMRGKNIEDGFKRKGRENPGL